MVNRTNIKTYSLKDRKSKVSLLNVKPIAKIQDQINSPEFNELIKKIKESKKLGKPIIWMIGGHSIKVGLSRYIIDLIKKGFITHLASNGSASIHDFELALIGATSEDVLNQIKDGSFGMAEETGGWMNQAINRNAEKGYGSAIGTMIEEKNLPYKKLSLAYNCLKLKIPYTVHVAIGTDIIHQHPSCDGARIGLATFNDFMKFTDTVCNLDKGVVLNICSAVIMPEVFLKALSISRNLGYKTHNITTANFDMLAHYRPKVNIVERPTAHGGIGFDFREKHEHSIPSLYSALVYS